MSESCIPTLATMRTDALANDVFAAARWFDGLWNSSAKAVSPTEIEWQCQTWGSGRGCADWVQIAVFILVMTAFGLESWRKRDGRDELVVVVPLDRFREIARLVDRVGQEPECWPWFDEDYNRDQQIAVAAEVLGMSTTAVAADSDILEALRIK